MAVLRRPLPSSSSSAALLSPSVATLLSSCSSLRGLAQIHGRIVRKGLEQHPVLLTRFISLCDALDSPSYAAAAFSEGAAPSLVLFNALLAAHARHSPLSAAIAHFNLLRRRCPDPPDAFSFPSLLLSCSRAANLLVGASVHAAIVRCGLEADLFVCTALVDFYGKCRVLAAAQTLFDSMEVRNVVSWTAMIAGYLSCGDLVSARALFDVMPTRNVATWNAIIDGYVKCGDLAGANKLFHEMPERDVVSCTSLIDGFAKAGDMASARCLFEELKTKDRFSWSAMVSGYAQNGQAGVALRLFHEFCARGMKPDEFIVVGLMSSCSQLGNPTLARWVESYIAENSIDIKNTHVLAGLIDMNAKCGNMERAAFLFESMPYRDMISCCSLMQGYCLHGLAYKAVELFSRMLQKGISPDCMAFTVVLTACSNAGLVEEGKKYFELMRNEYLIAPSADHYACIVDLLGRSGRLREAYELIESMPLKPHAGVWGALLGACRIHCDIELGNMVAEKLFKIEPLNAGNYVALSNIYATANRWADVSEVRDVMRKKGVRKIPGCTWILP